MLETRIKIGLTGAVHPNMPGDDGGVYRRVIKDMEKLKTEFDFDMVVLPEPLVSEDDGRKAREFMDRNEVDFTMIFCASLPFGRLMLPLARVNSYIGIWAVPEPTTDGVLQQNSFCGLNMLGSIVANYLREYNLPFKWFYGYPETGLFRDRFLVTLRALRAIKTLKHSRIGVIGGLADGFENMYTDERILEKRFGTYIQTRHTVEEIVDRARKYDDAKVNEMLNEYHAEGTVVTKRVTTEAMDRSARVNLALLDFAEENNYNALAISCWSRFQQVYGIAVCGSMSRLNEAGIVAPCEADLSAAVSMLILNGMNGQVSTLNDMVALDEGDNSLNLWHCGVAAKSWADKAGVQWDAHFNIGEYDGDEWKGKGVVSSLQMKPGKITISTMDNDFDNLFVVTGDIMKDKAGYFGGSGWVNNLKMHGEKLDIQDLINTISVNRVNHHYPSAFGDLSNELMEFASWKNLNVLERVPYKPYMQNRPE